MNGGMIPHPFIAEHDGPEAYIPTAMPRSLDIGYGIPRNPRTSWGIRRAVFDLAYGYVSGFPILDVLTFSARSLFPRRR